MPIPFIIGGIAAIAGALGVGSGIHGGMKMKEANDTMRWAKEKQEKAISKFKSKNASTTKLMDDIGKQELQILDNFKKFSDLIERIQGRPDFKSYSRDGVELPKFEAEDLKEVAVGAGVLLGGLGGAAAGTAGGFAGAGAATAAVMAVGTASTGTALSSLSGAALTNATLAALGGGSLAAGGGGMALGTAVLGGATLGVGLLVGGIIFNATGSHLSDKADEAYKQAQETERKVNKIVKYLNELSSAAQPFKDSLTRVEGEYKKRYSSLYNTVEYRKKTNWSDFTDEEKLTTENLVLLVGLLYKMCRVNLVIKSTSNKETNKVNHEDINSAVHDASVILDDIAA